MTALLHLGVAAIAVAVVLAFIAVRRVDRGLFAAARLAAATGVVILGTLLLRLGLAGGRFPVTTIHEFTLLLAVTLLVAGLLLDLWRGAPILTVTTAPLALVILLIAVAMRTDGSQPSAKVLSVWTGLHVIATVIAFGGFAVAFVCGLLYLIEQRQLKGHAGGTLLGLMPSLETLYRLTIQGIFLGVVLLTAGVLLGYLHARKVEAGASWRTDPKVLLTTATWAGYLVVLALSRVPSLRGRRTALAAVICFVLVVVTFWATPFWSTFHPYR